MPEAVSRPISIEPDAATVVETGVGPLVVTARGEAVVGVAAPGESVAKAKALLAPRLDLGPAVGVLRAAADQLVAYGNGRLEGFELPLALPESPLRPFWDACLRIPYGWTTTYGDLAKDAGHAGEARTAGTAMATNPIAVVIPCHRVVDSQGGLHGYGGGLAHKRLLLDLEGAPRTKESLGEWLARRHPDAARPLIGVRSTRIFCLPDCRGGMRLDFEGHVVTSFASVDEGKAAGYRACKLCTPEAPQGALL